MSEALRLPSRQDRGKQPVSPTQKAVMDSFHWLELDFCIVYLGGTATVEQTKPTSVGRKNPSDDDRIE